MANFQSEILDAKFILDMKDQPENYNLLNSVLNLEESPMAEMNTVFRNVTDKVAMEWLDLMDFKEEQNAEENSPEIDRERKKKHNRIERARRLFIDAKIRELEFLLPKTNENFHELAKDIKHNKGGILGASVDYLRILKYDQIKKQEIEERCNIQDLQNRKLMMKLQEYEREMKSYGIPVKEVTVEVFQDQNDLNGTVGVTKRCSTTVDSLKTSEQIDDLMDDDMHPVCRNDPMFFNLDSSKSSSSLSTLSRCSSPEYIEDSGESVTSEQKKTPRKEKRKVKKHSYKNKPAVNTNPRIPVISKPHNFKQRFNPNLKHQIPKTPNNEFSTSSSSSMVFPLPQGLSQLTNQENLIRSSLKPSSFQLATSPSSSSEDEQHWSNVMFDKKVKCEENVKNPSQPPRPLSVIRKIVSANEGAISDETIGSDKPLKRKVILQERI